MEQLSEQMKKLLEQAVAAGQVAGANLLVLQGDRELVYTQAGFADVEQQRPFDRDTICRIYSMTKPVTAVAAMILVERGQLDLGTWLGDILPEFRDMQVWEGGKKVPARRQILIKELLTMTSGLSYPGGDDSGAEVARVFERLDQRLYSEDPMTTEQWAREMSRCALAFHPGERWMYGTSADILGRVIEQVSGMSMGDFMKQEIFDPLGMKDTGFWVSPEKQGRLAQVYEQTEAGMRLYETNHLGICYTAEKPPVFHSGGAGLTSTIDDYGKIACSLRGYGVQILRPETVRWMTGQQLLPWQLESLWRSWEGLTGYGYGGLCRTLIQPSLAVVRGWKGEYGWDGWLGTYFCNSPQNDVTVLLFTQRRDSGTLPMTRKLRNVLATRL